MEVFQNPHFSKLEDLHRFNVEHADVELPSVKSIQILLILKLPG